MMHEVEKLRYSNSNVKVWTHVIYTCPLKIKANWRIPASKILIFPQQIASGLIVSRIHIGGLP
jgi:hypothetical protein